MTRKKKVSIGSRLVASMTQLVDVLESRATEERHFTVRTVQIPDPMPYSARSVKHLRNRLGVSQAIFAQLLGVSPVLVQHWEQGVAVPRPLARRLMDEVALDPNGYLRRYMSPRRLISA